jgi:predicted metal-dependent HD superfamily phosphohydrolase
VELALWFHDAIYDPRRYDNEELSAALAAETVSSFLSTTDTMALRELILATKHSAVPIDPDAALVVDIDLSILGRSKEIFDAYENGIREEYDWVPAKAFASGRASILKRFLERPRIYTHDFFFQRYESQARINLTQSVEHLEFSLREINSNN